MRHFSCDLCGKDLTPGHETRFVLRMEVSVATDTASAPADLDQDQLEEMADLLDELENGDTVLDIAPVSKKLEFDLCPLCHRKFLADPLGRETNRKPEFSSN